MIHQQDPVGLITFDDKIRHSLPPRSKRTQLGNVLSLLAKLRPTGKTDIAKSLIQIAAMLRHRSLIMLFTDLLADPEPIIQALHRLRHGGHDVILFHILDEAEVQFPVRWPGRVRRTRDRTTSCKSTPDGFKARLSGRDEPVLRPIPARMFSKRHRLRAARHQHADSIGH